jgi:hypothetical protein
MSYRENLRVIIDMAQHDPLAILGFLLIATSSVLFIQIQFKMREIGYKTYPMFNRPIDWILPAEYLRVRRRQGWSPWPAYLVWPSLVFGMVALVVGLFRLRD